MTTTQEKLAELDAQIAELTEYRETVRLFEEGMEIQFQNPANGAWENIDTPGWEPDIKYRVAPEPITCWLIVSKAGVVLWREYDYEQDADTHCDIFNNDKTMNGQPYRVVKMVETA